MGKPKLPPGTWFEKDMLESAAYNALKGWGPQLLTHFLRKRQFDKIRVGKREKRICVNCDAMHFTGIEAEKKYSVTQPRFTRAIDELLAKGFISVKHQGGAYKQDKSIYSLSDKWTIWTPGMVLEIRKKDPIQRGFRKPKTKVTYENLPKHTYENVPKEAGQG